MSESYVTAVHIVRVLFAVFLMPCSISIIFPNMSYSICIIFMVQCPVVFL